MELVLKFFTALIKRHRVYCLMWQNCLYWKNQLGAGLVKMQLNKQLQPTVTRQRGRVAAELRRYT